MDVNRWNFDVIRSANEVLGSGLSMAHDTDEVVAMVKGMAEGMDEPEAGWYVADVLNAINEREMALE